MKDGLKYLIGKRISGVVVAASDREPRNQVFLVFDDGTRFEFWGPSFSCCSGLDDAAGLVDYLKSGKGEIAALYGDVRLISAAPGASKVPATARSPSRPSLPKLVQHVLGARRQAREAIDRAKGKR